MVDADYYVGPVWTGSLIDADTVFESFHKYCHEAGEKCDFYRKDDTPTDIADRLQGVLARIRKDPIILADESTRLPEVIYESDIRGILFSSLYHPMSTFPMIATMFNQLDRGNNEFVKFFLAVFNFGTDLPSLCGPSPPPEAFPDEALLAIMCSDKRYPVSTSSCDHGFY